tara:strand:+ start:531 stop:671 length:141 start_codon:yes stop_codon:yes gene_type:complete
MSQMAPAPGMNLRWHIFEALRPEQGFKITDGQFDVLDNATDPPQPG